MSLNLSKIEEERSEVGERSRPPENDKERRISALRIERRDDGQMWAVRAGNEAAVRVRRCFPWTDGQRFISLRDVDDEEFALVGSLGELDGDSRSVLEQGLAEAGFVMEIATIHALDEEVEIHVWDVETRQGRRSFQTRRDDWPREMPGGGLLIRDVVGDLYWVRDPGKLDPRSARLLWIFVD